MEYVEVLIDASAIEARMRAWQYNMKGWMFDSYYRDWPEQDVLLDFGLMDAIPPQWVRWEEMLERFRLKDKWR